MAAKRLDLGLTGLEAFKAGRTTPQVPFWDPPVEPAPAYIGPSPRSKIRPASARYTPAPAYIPPPPLPRSARRTAPTLDDDSTRFIDAAPSTIPYFRDARPLAFDAALKPLAGTARLSPRQRAMAVKSINDSHINQWLAARGQLPTHRTISKARRAALASCYNMVSTMPAGFEDEAAQQRLQHNPPPPKQGVDVSDMKLVLRALGFRPEVVSAVLRNARPDERGVIDSAEFTRLCVEAEQASKRKISAFESPRAQADAFPLALLMERHRIHEHITRLDGSAEEPVSRNPTPPPRPPSPRGSNHRGVAPPTGNPPFRRAVRRTTQQLRHDPSGNRA